MRKKERERKSSTTPPHYSYTRTCPPFLIGTMSYLAYSPFSERQCTAAAAAAAAFGQDDARRRVGAYGQGKRWSGM